MTSPEDSPVGAGATVDPSGGGARPSAGRESPTVLLASAAPGVADAAEPPPGTPAYELMGEIGRGGMSVVHLARDTRLGRFVAFKRLGTGFRDDPEMRERFFREARLIATLNHIHIVRLFDVGEDEQGPYLVMEYIAGPARALLPDRPAPSLNLEQRVEQKQAPLWPREAVNLVRKLCGAIDYAHRHGVIHRDLKPSNVLLDEFSEPRIADFGLARRAQAGAGPGLTQSGTRLLSLGYGAPEQEVDSGRADGRADIYSLGGILYFCLTGENPRFFRDSRIVNYLRPALLKALDRDPAQRWSTAGEFAEALAQSAADYLSPVSDVGMWRCKWCSALNPLSARFCHQCRWDGLERCPECVGETRVGVRFCAGCGTDIKIFEDLRALVQRLRDYRRERDFARLKEAAEAAGQFQPRGPRGQELLRRIAELSDTAAWALERKESISQAITAAMAQEQYDVARDRLNEYDLLAGDDRHDALREELPWRMAERDLLAAAQAERRARQMLAGGQLAACREAMEEARAGRLHLARLAAQFPALQPLFAGAEGGPGGVDAPAFARELDRLAREVEALTRSLDEAEARVANLLAEAGEAQRAQDYARAMACCQALAGITRESPAAEAVRAAAQAAQDRIDQLLGDADRALAAGDVGRAQRLCGLILDRYQSNCRRAVALRDRAARRRRVRLAAAAALSTLAAALLYGLSIGPAYRAAGAGGGTTAGAAPSLARFYTPVRWLHAHTALRRPLEAYLRWWGVPSRGAGLTP